MTWRSQYVSALTLAHACARVVSFQKTSPNTSPLPDENRKQDEEGKNLMEQWAECYFLFLYIPRVQLLRFASSLSYESKLNIFGFWTVSQTKQHIWQFQELMMDMFHNFMTFYQTRRKIIRRLIENENSYVQPYIYCPTYDRKWRHLPVQNTAIWFWILSTTNFLLSLWGTTLWSSLKSKIHLKHSTAVHYFLITAIPLPHYLPCKVSVIAGCPF